MQDTFTYADDLGPSKIIQIYEPVTGLKAVVVVDNVLLGPAIGGVRFAPDVSVEEAFRLARAMTLKNAAAGIPHGGAKAVIFGDPDLPAPLKEIQIRAFGSAIKDLSEYIPGPDMGTDETCMAWVKEETGRAIGLPRELGGIPLDQIGATGWGLFQAIETGIEHWDFGNGNFDIKGARVVVQGFGAVGRNVSRFLVERGAVLVGAANIEGAIYNRNGLDVARLTALLEQGGAIFDYADADQLERDSVLEMGCEIWIPAARPDVLTGQNVHRLKTKIVAEGANIPCTEEAERWLHQRGVLVLPDFIANAGGVISGAVEFQGGTEAEAFQAIKEKIRANTRTVMEEARGKNILPREAAVEIARTRLREAQEFSRWNSIEGKNPTGKEINRKKTGNSPELNLKNFA